MADCCSPDSERYRDVFDPRFAARVARRYRTRGPSTTGRRIVDFVAAHGLDGSTVLEVGGGVGELQLELLARGAVRTHNLELSAGYEDEAARLIAERGVHGRVTRTTGIDLANQPERVPVADIVILHRVVCCYDDAERLLAAAADHARRLVAFSYPPRTLLTRSLVSFGNLRMRLVGYSYRGFVHRPDSMIDVLRRHGLEGRYHHRGVSWCVFAAERT